MYKGSSAITTHIPEEGFDYSVEVRNSDTDQTAAINAVDGSSEERIYIRTPVPVDGFTITVGTANTESVTMSNIEYRKDDGTWGTVSDLTDGTDDVSGKVFGDTGAADVTFTAPTDIQP